MQNGGIKAVNTGGVALAVTGDGTVTTGGTSGAALHVKASSTTYKGAVLKLEHAVGRCEHGQMRSPSLPALMHIH